MKMEIDLQRFCLSGDQVSRYTLNKPFVRAGYRYATDTRLCVRVPSPGEEDTRGIFPAAEILECGFTSNCTHEISEAVPMADMDVCPECATVCETCADEGEGMIGEDWDCSPCIDCVDGFRYSATCVLCNGSHRMPYMLYGKTIIAPNNHQRISTLPGVRWSEGKLGLPMVAFTLDGGEGVCMGCHSSRQRVAGEKQ